ncbi:MAG: hypothetical protein AB7K52_00600 [Phycisphaerales bacterium]
MGELTARNFGLLIAYVLPGFVGLWGLGYLSEPVRTWLSGAGPAGPSMGGVLYVLVASIGCGMTASAVRWALVDSVYHRTGLRRPAWDDSKLPERLDAFEALVDNHFRYYQFYSNSMVSAAAAYAAWRWSPDTPKPPVGLLEVVLLLLLFVFIAGSRDALRRYYGRTALLLGTQERMVDDDERTQAHPAEPGPAAETVADDHRPPGEVGPGGDRHGGCDQAAAGGDQVAAAKPGDVISDAAPPEPDGAASLRADGQ